MTEFQLAFLMFMFLIGVAVASICWLWDATGDVVDEVDSEFEPYQALRRIK